MSFVKYSNVVVRLHHNLIKCVSCHRLLSSDNTESVDPPLPGRKLYFNEANEVKRSRLIYQSRKRGTLENGLIFSTFAARYLNSMSPLHLDLYDKLLNEPSNEWDIYYWITGNKPTPSEYDNEVMRMLKEHARNSQKEVRNQMPNL